jgi:hypothetical protein
MIIICVNCFWNSQLFLIKNVTTVHMNWKLVPCSPTLFLITINGYFPSNLVHLYSLTPRKCRFVFHMRSNFVSRFGITRHNALQVKMGSTKSSMESYSGFWNFYSGIWNLASGTSWQEYLLWRGLPGWGDCGCDIILHYSAFRAQPK